jgi:hypothetical protein
MKKTEIIAILKKYFNGYHYQSIIEEINNWSAKDLKSFLHKLGQKHKMDKEMMIICLTDLVKLVYGLKEESKLSAFVDKNWIVKEKWELYLENLMNQGNIHATGKNIFTIEEVKSCVGIALKEKEKENAELVEGLNTVFTEFKFGLDNQCKVLGFSDEKSKKTIKENSLVVTTEKLIKKYEK